MTEPDTNDLLRMMDEEHGMESVVRHLIVRIGVMEERLDQAKIEIPDVNAAAYKRS